MSWFGWFFGSNQSIEPKLDEIEKVETICERINSCTLLEDKRNSLLELRSISETSKLEVGTRSMNILFEILKTYSQDKDLVVLSLDIIANVLNCSKPLKFENNEDLKKHDPLLSEQLCEIMLKESKNIQILIETLDNPNYQIRWAVIKIFIAISHQQLTKFQGILSEVHFGLPRISEILRDSREMLRNDCLLLLILLSQNDKNIQKMLVFDNIFEKLFNIINNEGGLNGGMITQDCLVIIKNLLIKNSCTQNHLRELGLFSNLKPFLKIPLSLINQPVWPINTLSNLIGFIEILRVLVDPKSVTTSVKSSQNSISSSGILQVLFESFQIQDLPETLIIEICSAISEAVRGNNSLQNAFLNYISLKHSNQDPMVILLHPLLNHKICLSVKKSILYLIQSLFFKNTELCEKTINYLIESEKFPGLSNLSKFLYAGFFDHDKIFSWISCSCLVSILTSYPQGKLELLKVRLLHDNTPEQRPISLPQCSLLLLQNSKVSRSIKINILCFLITMLFDCPVVVDEFLKLKDASSLPLTSILDVSNNCDCILRGFYGALLVVYINFSNETLRQEISKNVSVRLDFSDVKKLVSDLIYNSDFILSSKSPRPRHDLNFQFDYNFTNIIKKIEFMSNEIFGDETSHSSRKIPKDLEEKDIEIGRLNSICRQLENEVQELQFIQEETNKTIMNEVNYWKNLHSDLNKDFQKLLENQQKLLSVLENQEHLIQDLKAQINQSLQKDSISILNFPPYCVQSSEKPDVETLMSQENEAQQQFYSSYYSCPDYGHYPENENG